VSEVPEAGQRDGGKPGGTAASALGLGAIKTVDEQSLYLLGHRCSISVNELIINLSRPKLTRAQLLRSVVVINQCRAIVDTLLVSVDELRYFTAQAWPTRYGGPPIVVTPMA
jgi:hypothetical protein